MGGPGSGIKGHRTPKGASAGWLMKKPPIRSEGPTVSDVYKALLKPMRKALMKTIPMKPIPKRMGRWGAQSVPIRHDKQNYIRFMSSNRMVGIPRNVRRKGRS